MQLTNEERAALREYQAGHGRTWKASLRKDWMDGGTIGILQALRNTVHFGPKGLDRLSAEDLIDLPEIETGHHWLRVERVNPSTGIKAWEPWSMVFVYRDPHSDILSLVWWMAGRERMANFIKGCMQRGLQYEFTKVAGPNE